MCVCQYECRGVPEVNYLTLEPLLRAAAGQHLGLTETDVEVHLRLFTQNKLVLPCFRVPRVSVHLDSVSVSHCGPHNLTR